MEKIIIVWRRKQKWTCQKSHSYVLTEIGLETKSLSLYYVLSSISRIKNYTVSPSTSDFQSHNVSQGFVSNVAFHKIDCICLQLDNGNI